MPESQCGESETQYADWCPKIVSLCSFLSILLCRSFRLFICRFCFVLDKTKNDRAGLGPVEGRTFRVGCCCAELLGTKERKAFLVACGKDPDHPCHFDCPYQVVEDYLTCIPDRDGSAQLAQHAVNPALTSAPLKIMRARSASGARHFINGNLGVGQLRGIMARVNEQLPIELQVCTIIQLKFILIYLLRFNRLTQSLVTQAAERLSLSLLMRVWILRWWHLPPNTRT